MGATVDCVGVVWEAWSALQAEVLSTLSLELDLFFQWNIYIRFSGVLTSEIEKNSTNIRTQQFSIRTGVSKKGRVKRNPHSKIDPIMPGH